MAAQVSRGAISARPRAAGFMLGAAMLATALGLTSVASANIAGTFSGVSYGASANLAAGEVATSLGRTAHQACPCRGTGGRVLTSSVAGIEAVGSRNILSAGLTRGAAQTTRTARSATVRNIATLTDLSVLGGLITADLVRGVTQVHANRGSMAASMNESRFLNLRVAGQAIGADVAPNTRLALPGVGRVTIKAVRRVGDFEQIGGIELDMLLVEVLQDNRFGLDIGAEIEVGHSVSRFSRQTVEAVVGGQAYGTALETENNLGLQNQIGKAALLGIPCTGIRGGEVQTMHASALQVGNVLSLGAAESTRQGGETPSGGMVRMTNTVESVSLLGGLIRAAEVRAVAHSVLDDGVRSDSAAGSGISGFRLAGVPIGDVTRPNLRVTVPGVGYAVLNEQIPPEPGTRQRLQVTGLHVVVNKINLFGLGIGTDLTVAHAESTIFE